MGGRPAQNHGATLPAPPSGRWNARVQLAEELFKEALAAGFQGRHFQGPRAADPGWPLMAIGFVILPGYSLGPVSIVSAHRKRGVVTFWVSIRDLRNPACTVSLPLRLDR